MQAVDIKFIEDAWWVVKETDNKLSQWKNS